LVPAALVAPLPGVSLILFSLILSATMHCPALEVLAMTKVAATPFSWRLRYLANSRPDSIEGRAAARAVNKIRAEAAGLMPDLQGVDFARSNVFNDSVARMSERVGGGIASPLDLLRSRDDRVRRFSNAAHQRSNLGLGMGHWVSRSMDYPDRVLAQFDPHSLYIGKRTTPEELSANRHRFSSIGAHDPEPGVADVSVGGVANHHIRKSDGKTLPMFVKSVPRVQAAIPAASLPYDPSKIIYRAHQAVAEDKPLWASPHPDVPARYTTGIVGDEAPRPFVAKGLPSEVRPDVHYSPHVGNDGLTQTSPRTAASPTAPIPKEIASPKHHHRADLIDYETTLPGGKFEALPTLAHIPPKRLPAYGLDRDRNNAEVGKAMSKRILGVESGTAARPSHSPKS